MKIYRPGPLPWAKVPVIGYPHAFGIPTEGWTRCDVRDGVIDVRGHVQASAGFDDQNAQDIHDMDAYHAEYAADKARRGRPEVTCMWCHSLNEQRVLIRTANRRN